MYLHVGVVFFLLLLILEYIFLSWMKKNSSSHYVKTNPAESHQGSSDWRVFARFWG
jgi:hypothetical protein